MTSLTPSNRAKLRRAKRAGDSDALDQEIEEVVDDQLGRWARSKWGQYGLVEDCESREGQQRAAEIIRLAWEKLKDIAHEEVRETIDEYEEAQGGPPEFDAEGKAVRRRAGGSTQTLWERIPGGYRQRESRRIYIGSKWICRRKRSGHKHVIIAVMHTILHELMGHWDKVGQKVPGTNEDQRRVRAEDRADDVTADHWDDLKDTERWDDCVAELEEEFETRRPAAEEDIRERIDTYLDSLSD